FGLNVVGSGWIWLPVFVPKAWLMTSNLVVFGLRTTLGSPATANWVGQIGWTQAVFENAVNGANDSGAHVSPPSLEYEKPQPSLYSQSFQAPASHWPFGLIPSDSSLLA